MPHRVLPTMKTRTLSAKARPSLPLNLYPKLRNDQHALITTHETFEGLARKCVAYSPKRLTRTKCAELS